MRRKWAFTSIMEVPFKEKWKGFNYETLQLGLTSLSSCATFFIHFIDSLRLQNCGWVLQLKSDGGFTRTFSRISVSPLAYSNIKLVYFIPGLWENF